MLGAEAPTGTTNCAYLKQPDKQESPSIYRRIRRGNPKNNGAGHYHTVGETNRARRECPASRSLLSVSGPCFRARLDFDDVPPESTIAVKFFCICLPA